MFESDRQLVSCIDFYGADWAESHVSSVGKLAGSSYMAQLSQDVSLWFALCARAYVLFCVVVLVCYACVCGCAASTFSFFCFCAFVLLCGSAARLLLCLLLKGQRQHAGV